LITQFVTLMAPQGGEGGGSMVSTLVMFALIILIFYFMILRPQQKRQKERQKLLDGVKKGDKITTIGGIHATVLGLEEKAVLIQISDTVKIKIDKSAVANITKPAEGETS